MMSRLEFSLSNLASPSGRGRVQGPSPTLGVPTLRAPRPRLPSRAEAPAASQLQQTGTDFRHRRRGRRSTCVRCTAAAISLGSEAGATIRGAVQPVRQVASDLLHRSISGSLLGLTGVAVILAGGWVFTIATCLLVYQFSQEFFGFVTSKGISEGMLPPPPLVSALTSLLCICVTVWTHVLAGNSTAALAVSSFLVLSLQLLTVERPHFSQMTSTVFGLFYCGYLPSFWVKLRLLAVPAINSTMVHGWPVALGGLTHWTVGLIACIMSVACIIASDTGAYFTGRAVGRTQLIKCSPKKTVEGAIGGMLASVATALLGWRFLQWPGNPLVACALGLLVFLASLFGDLIESVMKRNAGMKDASNLIPGHGGLLDRFDSYMFTGAIVYFQLKFVVPAFGL